MSTPNQPLHVATSAGREPLSPPASPVLARRDENTPPAPSPATVEPPAKRRKKDSDALSNKTDEEVWDYSDKDLLDSIRSKWKSDVYSHFIPSLVRDATTSPRSITIVLTCKYDNPQHTPVSRLRQTSSGFNTSNLGSSVRTCVSRDPVRAASIATPQASSSVMPYSEAMHRTLIALRCASSKRAFNQVEDRWYLKEVEMLRPGTKVPSADTVARDVQRLYSSLAIEVRDYFQRRAREIHAVIDGWTAPMGEQYLGVGIIWEDRGEIYYITLEFIRLTERHCGKYLAEKLAEALKKYGLERFLHLLMMDNAGNCNTTAGNLVMDIPTFRGILARGRCFTHIIQLVAKMIISFFFKQAKRKKSIKVKKGSAKRTTAASANVELDEMEEMVIWEDDPTADAEDLEMAEVMHETEDDAVPTGQEVHDAKVTSAVRTAATEEMRKQRVIVSAQEEKDALKLFPKVAGLAKKVHDSRPIHTEFAAIVANPDTGLSLDSNVTELARRNATRWGSEYSCLLTRQLLTPAVDKLLKDKNFKLGAYAFNDHQKRLAGELRTLLEVLERPSKLFQSKNRPLIIDVIPEMEDIDYMLKAISEATDQSNVIRVAAHAGLLVLRKYYALLDECEAYRISIVLCPDRKLQWFRDRDWTDAQIADLRSLVIRRFEESYKTEPTAASTSIPLPLTSTTTGLDRFRRPGRNVGTSTSECDNIHTYLDSPICTPPGTVIQYWNERLTPSPGSAVIATPDLARYGLSFCSCPATSVDGERAFSEGRHQMAWNQKLMSSQAFRAQMSVGSWAGAPFFDLASAVAALEAETASLR